MKKILIKGIILFLLLITYIGIILLNNQYKMLEIIMFCIDIASFSIIGILSIILTIISFKLKNKFWIENGSIIIAIIYDIFYTFIIIFQFIKDNLNFSSFSILLIPLINGLFINILISYIMKGKVYEY